MNEDQGDIAGVPDMSTKKMPWWAIAGAIIVALLIVGNIVAARHEAPSRGISDVVIMPFLSIG